MNKVSGNYDEVMKFVFDVKERATEETDGMNFKEYVKYIEQDLGDIKTKIKENKLVKK